MENTFSNIIYLNIFDITILALAHSLMHTLEEEIYKQQDTNETLSIKMGMGFLPVLVIWSGSGQ